MNQEKNHAGQTHNFADDILAADRKARSWKEKLEWVDAFLENTPVPDIDQLAYLSIYMRFISTGRITTCEDGRHFRPGHHARLSQQIDAKLQKAADPSNAFIMRKIYPYLPSYAGEFMRAEPLTRIRDIAHRNDIPRELKDEIKHTLQNKLHRCAGPEDLDTSASILSRITSPGAEYSQAFVSEFRIFHDELKEFFNAQSLDERLWSMVNKADTEDAALIKKFLHSREGGEASIKKLILTLKLLTRLRQRFSAKAVTEGGAEAQEMRLADIGLEDYAFVLLSELINRFDKHEPQWEEMLHSLCLTLDNLRISSMEPEECDAIECGINAIQLIFDPDDHDGLLCLKASVDRCLRLSCDYSDRILSLFPPKVKRLGRGLGIHENTIKFFSEGDIRGNLVFQLSKLGSCLLRHIRAIGGLQPWDAIVAGITTGAFIKSENLDGLNIPADEQVIVMPERVSGDEEIPAGVAGIILGHNLPHLSHLGVRARQAGVIFASCEDGGEFKKLKKLTGKRIILSVTAEAVNIDISADISTDISGGSVKKPAFKHGLIPASALLSGTILLELDKVSVSSGGGKAYGAGRLEELSKQEGSKFKTPQGISIPFGMMEISLDSDHIIKQEYLGLIEGLNELSPADLKIRLEHIRSLVQKLTVPDKIILELNKRFGNDERLAIRSSSNCEDMDNFAGAGLYESIVNVKVSEAAGAILRVWASLWTKRAVISRKQSGIPHNLAHMSILIQKMVVPDYSFIIHTTNPVTFNPDEAYIELAPGLGETLASGATRGSPYRMICNKNTGEAQMTAFANFSCAVMPAETGGLSQKTADYSKETMTVNAAYRKDTGKRLAGIAGFIEEAFGYPQDIEGAVSGDDIYLIQSRPQQGIQKVPLPKITALFQKRIEGDDALLQLAALRFAESGLGPEFYADTPDELGRLLGFINSADAPAVVHLPRSIDILKEDSAGLILDFASRFKGRIYGMVMHDQPEIATSFNAYSEAAREINRRLKETGDSPYLFIEYAVFLDPALFLNFFREIEPLSLISACLDIGHAGIRQIMHAYSQKHPGDNVCALKPDDPGLSALMDDITDAVNTALPVVLDMIKYLGSLKKPLHFHLHDGHPLSTFSPFGVSDHLSFFNEIPIPFEHKGRHAVPLMFGPAGISEIVKTAVLSIDSGILSFSLEMHPSEGRLPLGNASHIFNHWKDQANAERMNYWLSVLLQNHQFIKKVLEQNR